ncbi:MAG: type II toxin-antitoxin system VapC family toxin [Xanthobacteraceae bacterium]|jgi:tRNA(fMet)-specific endonuclease VapC
MICLDTNAVITMLNEPASRVEAQLRAALRGGNPVAISSLVLFELWHGAAKSARTERNIDRIKDFLVAPIQVLAFDADDAREAGEIRAALERLGTPIGPYDILIAAQARRRGATLVTANEREFARVPGLQTEDWAA